jgi:hypothetical protein
MVSTYLHDNAVDSLLKRRIDTKQVEWEQWCWRRVQYWGDEVLSGTAGSQYNKQNATNKGFGKGFGLSLCAVPLTQQVPHLGGIA